MTREELEEKLTIGEFVTIVMEDRKFMGRVDEFCEDGLKLINLVNDRPKRIDYAFIDDLDKGEEDSEDVIGLGIDRDYKMIFVPEIGYMMGQTPVTQSLYKKVMGENPSWFQFSNDKLSDRERSCLERDGQALRNPVENVSWYDAIYFCNKLSLIEGLEPAYFVDGEVDPEYWGYIPHHGEILGTKVLCDIEAKGYRLPLDEEWEESTGSVGSYNYSGSDDLDEVGWYGKNSSFVTHPVGLKKANDFGLYDMSGNVWEWVSDFIPDRKNYHCSRGGCYSSQDLSCGVSQLMFSDANERNKDIGFRLYRLLE
ncbi:MAG: SUMF1/EgtB/PvdO family nonheme iron enzyme [Treponema sp.]|nr:SUMF1/EgtB/PvdO family nonheme iron enzyme [Treponema sp.]